MISRRAFVASLTGSVLAAPLAAQAQPARTVPRLGLLFPESGPSPRIEAFRQGLRELGYIEGKTIVIEYRFAEGQRERLPELAAELVQLKVDVIVALSTLAAQPAKAATTTIPIVMISSDPIGTGVVAGLSRPGGNVTGLTTFADLAGKRLELLKEVVPRLARVAVLWDAGGPSKVIEFRGASTAATVLGVELQSLEVRAPHPDLDGAFEAARRGRAQGLVVLHNPLILTYRRQIVGMTLRDRLPTIFEGTDYTEIGGLISYGPKLREVFGRAAAFVDKILRGAKPADLPVEQPTMFELVINLKTAKALGLTIPPTLLARADQVIE